jgi:hypothetical protein
MGTLTGPDRTDRASGNLNFNGGNGNGSGTGNAGGNSGGSPPMPPSTSGRRWVRPSWGAESCATSRA